MVHCGEKNLVQ